MNLTQLQRVTAFLILTVNLFSSVSELLAAEAAQPRPNIVFILADDLGYADLSLHGNAEVSTPNIDSLAKEGARFTDAYVSCPYCSPTRAGLLTGRYQQRFGQEFNPALLKHGGAGQGLPSGEKTIADRLRAAGYATGLVGKWHQGEEEQFHPLNRGFDEFFGFLTGAHTYLTSDDPNFGPIYRGRQPVELKGYLTPTLGDEACQFIDRHRAQPFFLYLAFNAVHTPLEPPLAPGLKVPNVRDSNRLTYLAMLMALDQAVGSVLTKLHDTNLDKQTLVFFFSDNGGPTTKFSPNASRNTPLRGSKGDTWEGGIRVPMLARWSGQIAAGKVFHQPVISLDVAATALAIAGITPPADAPIDGVSLLPLVQGSSDAPPHESLYWRFGKQMAIRSGDWKLVRPSMGPGEYEAVAREPLLFNLASDKGELFDLAAQHPDKVRQLQAAWDAWNNTLAAPRWPATIKGKPIIELR